MIQPLFENCPASQPLMLYCPAVAARRRTLIASFVPVRTGRRSAHCLAGRPQAPRSAPQRRRTITQRGNAFNQGRALPQGLADASPFKGDAFLQTGAGCCGVTRACYPSREHYYLFVCLFVCLLIYFNSPWNDEPITTLSWPRVRWATGARPASGSRPCKAPQVPAGSE